MKTILALFFALTLAASAQSNITVTVTLTAEQAAWLAANARTNVLAPDAIIAKQISRSLEQRMVTTSQTEAEQNRRRIEHAAIKAFRELDDAQRVAALAVISGRKLTEQEKAMVKSVSDKVLAE